MAMASDQKKDNPVQYYQGKDITVTFEKDLCIHSCECINGLPEVFDVRKRPWINVSGSTSECIQKVIDTCPTKALKYTVLTEEE